MTWKSFLKLVEIQTKVASVFPFLIGTLATVRLYGHFDGLNFIIMLGALLSIDMATTAINNYMDYRKAIDTSGYGYNEHNAIVQSRLSIKTVEKTIALLLLTGILLGLYLVIRTDYIVLLVGVLAFAVGISYTFGPFPISRTPFGEIFSGVAMGFGIPFLAMYIHLKNPDWVKLHFLGDYISLVLNWHAILVVCWLTIPLVIGIGNIMFANNICDMEEDFKNGRFTLALSLGKPLSLKLFRVAYGFIYPLIIIGVVLKLLPWTSLIALGSFWKVNCLSNAFVKEPIKSKTFVLAVKSFIHISVWLLISWLIGF